MKKTDETGNPFKVPEGYFESLSDRIIERVREAGPEVPVTKGRTTVYRRLKPVLYMAAALAGIAIITAGILRVSNTGNNLILNDLNSESVLADALIEEIDTYTLESEVNKNSEAAATGNESLTESVILENIEESDITNNNQ